MVVGIGFAETKSSAGSPPLFKREIADTRRRQVVMKKVKRVLMAVLIGAILSLGAFAPISAFGQKNDNRPPKQPDKVKEPDKPPRGNSNSQGNSNRHGKP